MLKAVATPGKIASNPISEDIETRKWQEIRRKTKPDGSAQILDSLRGLVGYREELSLARHYIDNLPYAIQSERTKIIGVEIPRHQTGEGEIFTAKNCFRRSSYLTQCESTVRMVI